jgi:hypothetical protein
MTPTRSFASVRSYYFREAIAEFLRDELTYGPVRGGIDAWRLEDFRPIHADATAEARAWLRAATTKA